MIESYDIDKIIINLENVDYNKLSELHQLNRFAFYFFLYFIVYKYILPFIYKEILNLIIK